jgi:hypothetical protein
MPDAVTEITITSVERQRIRNDLKTHMEHYEIDAKTVASIIRENRERLKGKLSADTIGRFLDARQGSVTVGPKYVALIRRYLALPKETWESPPRAADNRPSPPVFLTLKSFFAMRPEKAKLSDKVIGVWAFYAYSEKGRSAVCRGAIQFSVADGELRAKEIQAAVPFGSTMRYYEEYVGHFLFRKNTMIVILREKIQSLPKFYILSLEPFENEQRQYMVMTGALLKIGAQQDVFSDKIHMIRDDAAFDKCDMISPSDVKEILPHLE